jgi:hypothetical protein
MGSPGIKLDVGAFLFRSIAINPSLLLRSRLKKTLE